MPITRPASFRWRMARPIDPPIRPTPRMAIDFQRIFMRQFSPGSDGF
jgi:hypothetical protein